MSIELLNNDISNAKDTSSGLVEWNNNSLNAIVYDIYYLLLSNVAQKVADTDALETTTPNESAFAIVYGSGLFQWQNNEPVSGTYYNALGGGYWVLLANYKGTTHYLSPLTSNQEQTITDVEPYPSVPLGGQGLIWDGTEWAFDYVPNYVGTDVAEGDGLIYDESIHTWVNNPNKVVVATDDYTVEETDDVIIFDIGAANKKCYLPSTYDGKRFTIICKRFNASSFVDISYSASPIASVSPSYSYGGSFDKAYRSIEVMWWDSGYIITKKA